MRIGYSVQGSSDRAFITGLQRRWCPRAELIPGRFRGKTKLALRREYNSICEDFAFKAVDVMVFITDGDGAPWRGVQRNERDKFPAERIAIAVHGVADRNIECWICANVGYVAEKLDVPAKDFMVDDPKAAFATALGITRDDKKEEEIAELVRTAPLHSWLDNNSFEDFYEQVRALSIRNKCTIENLRET